MKPHNKLTQKLFRAAKETPGEEEYPAYRARLDALLEADRVLSDVRTAPSRIQFDACESSEVPILVLQMPRHKEHYFDLCKLRHTVGYSPSMKIPYLQRTEETMVFSVGAVALAHGNTPFLEYMLEKGHLSRDPQYLIALVSLPTDVDRVKMFHYARQRLGIQITQSTIAYALHYADKARGLISLRYISEHFQGPIDSASLIAALHNLSLIQTSDALWQVLQNLFCQIAFPTFYTATLAKTLRQIDDIHMRSQEGLITRERASLTCKLNFFAQRVAVGYSDDTAEEIDAIELTDFLFDYLSNLFAFHNKGLLLYSPAFMQAIIKLVYAKIITHQEGGEPRQNQAYWKEQYNQKLACHIMAMLDVSNTETCIVTSEQEALDFQAAVLQFTDIAAVKASFERQAAASSFEPSRLSIPTREERELKAELEPLSLDLDDEDRPPMQQMALQSAEPAFTDMMDHESIDFTREKPSLGKCLFFPCCVTGERSTQYWGEYRNTVHHPIECEGCCCCGVAYCPGRYRDRDADGPGYC